MSKLREYFREEYRSTDGNAEEFIDFMAVMIEELVAQKTLLFTFIREDDLVFRLSKSLKQVNPEHENFIEAANIIMGDLALLSEKGDYTYE